MPKKYIVRLNEEEREQLTKIIRKLKGSSQKVRRAQIFLKADADGPAWTDAQIADAVSHETIRRTLKKRHDEKEDRVLGDSTGSRCRIHREHGRSARNVRETIRFRLSGIVHGRATGTTRRLRV